MTAGSLLTAVSRGHRRPIGGGEHGEWGFTLLEVMLAVGIAAALGLSVFTLSARRHGHVHAAALQFQAIVSEARAIAASTNDGPGSSGATIQVRRQKGESAVSIYRYRPIALASAKPQLAENALTMRTRAEIRLGDATTFAIFISSSGHSAASPDYDVATGDTPAGEPNCNSVKGEAIVFLDGPDREIDRLTCEMSQLELVRN